MTHIESPPNLTPTVARSTLNTTDEWNGTLVGDDRWFKWLEKASAFDYVARRGAFTARRETKQDGTAIWIGYLTIRGEVRKTYLGPGENLTADRLERAALRLHV